MADVHSKEARSYNMSRIRSKNTSPEMIVRRFLHRRGFRYRLHVKHLSGNPDLVLRKYRTVIFIHGCFWHGHQHCKYFVVPKTRSEWWLNKIDKNAKNDQISEESLKKEGWKVISIWECTLKRQSREETLDFLCKRILG